MNVRFRWKADVKHIQVVCLLNTESGRSVENIIKLYLPWRILTSTITKNYMARSGINCLRLCAFAVIYTFIIFEEGIKMKFFNQKIKINGEI